MLRDACTAGARANVKHACQQVCMAPMLTLLQTASIYHTLNEMICQRSRDCRKVAGVGPGLVFARRTAQLLELTDQHTLGLVPCAIGGSSLHDWQPHGKLWKDAVRRVSAALESGPRGKPARLAAMLWCEAAQLAQQSDASLRAARMLLVTHAERCNGRCRMAAAALLCTWSFRANAASTTGP